LLFKHTKKISEYDFDSEVDVNILGHIFENSLNEIDEITTTLTGFETLLGLEEVAIQSESITQSGLQTLSATQSGFQTLTGLDKTKTKRKKDGVFYTPKYITKYIVDNTIGKLCEEKKLEITLDETKYSSDKRITVATKKKLIETLDSYRKWLLQLTIVDPACGSGAFLNQALEFLITEHRYVDELQAKLFGDALVLSDVEGSILENNLFGVDLNEESVEIAKLSLWLRTAQRNRKLNSLNNNIKCGNSLIDDAAIAGEKAFNWQNEFPQVFAKGGFDVVIGNPPYVQYNDTFYGHFITNQCKDLYALFFEKGIIINKKSGMFGFITPSLFIKGMRYESLRKILLEKVSILEIDDLGDNVFQDVQMPTAITILKNISNSNQKWSDFIKGNTLIEKIQIKTIKISEITKIIRGLEIGKDKVNIGLNDVKFLTGEDIFRYGVRNFSFINFEIYNKYKKNEYYFTKDRIIIRETGNRITSVFINQNNIYQNRSLYSIKINDESEFSYSFLLAILNSKIIQYFYKIKFSANTNIFPKIRIGQVNELPIKKISLSDQQPFIEKADVMLSLNKSLQDITQKFSKYFSGQFKLDKLSGKLEKWYSLSFEDFIKEINKAIKTQKGSVLTKKDEFDWIDLFEENKAKANALQHQIATTDKAIDAMVYKLYNLTEDEIAIVENAS
jgi:type I restriction-modification system DNA methylase subunit